jgi:hypothetical protein
MQMPLVDQIKTMSIIMKRSVIAFLCFTAVGWAVSSQTARAQNPRVVTAAQANGVYKYYDNEFRILALGHNELKVQFDGLYHTLAKSVNMGYASGEATIDGNVATFIPDDTQGCKITMTFLPGKLVVKQDGDDATCGFGHNVYSTGTYKKIRSGKPKFENPFK